MFPEKGSWYHHRKEFKDALNKPSRQDLLKAKKIVHSQNSGSRQARRGASAPKDTEVRDLLLLK